MNDEPWVVKLMLMPRVGMRSLVGIGDDRYPISYGNYCSIKGGPYLCNIWAENLEEWARRNPDSGPIEVTEYQHAGERLGMVTDERLKTWCNSKPCVTGHGWPSVAVLHLVCGAMGIEPGNRLCGCENADQSPNISERWVSHIHSYICHRCGRTWEGDK
jgi:hypothetical protein